MFMGSGPGPVGRPGMTVIFPINYLTSSTTPAKGMRHFWRGFLGDCAVAFPICPLMLQRWAFGYFGPG